MFGCVCEGISREDRHIGQKLRGRESTTLNVGRTIQQVGGLDGTKAAEEAYQTGMLSHSLRVLAA
jgi:hypothetical protein